MSELPPLSFDNPVFRNTFPGLEPRCSFDAHPPFIVVYKGKYQGAWKSWYVLTLAVPHNAKNLCA
jgi:hypothetical protein